MKVSARIACGLRALLAMAKEPQNFHSVHRLAEQQGLSEALLRRTLTDLRKAGILQAERGRKGGYKLAKSPEKIGLAQVIQALDKDLALAFVGEGRRQPLRQPEKGCPTAPFWARMERTFWEALEEATLADVLSAGRSGQR